MKFMKNALSVFCFLAIAACTVICLYEVYNSYISKEPKNVITYRELAMQDGKDFSEGITATEENASPDVATPEVATEDLADEVSADYEKAIEIKTAEP